MKPILEQRASFIWNSNKIERLATNSIEDTLNIIKDYLLKKDPYEKDLYKKKFKYVIPHYIALQYVLNTFNSKKPEWIDSLYIHEKLMEHQLSDSNRGRLRSGQVYIGPHIPPAPGAKLIAAVEKYVRWLECLNVPYKNHKQLYGLIYDSHCHFEGLHPFIDGNGRSGRLLWLAFLNYHKFEFNEIDFADQQIYYRSLNQRRRDSLTYELNKSYWWYPPRPYKV